MVATNKFDSKRGNYPSKHTPNHRNTPTHISPRKCRMLCNGHPLADSGRRRSGFWRERTPLTPPGTRLRSPFGGDKFFHCRLRLANLLRRKRSCWRKSVGPVPKSPLYQLISRIQVLVGAGELLDVPSAGSLSNMTFWRFSQHI